MFGSKELIVRFQDQPDQNKNRLLDKYLQQSVRQNLQQSVRQNSSENHDDFIEDIADLYMLRICIQAKLISQIIAFIWRWIDDTDDTNKVNKQVAKILKCVFDHPYKGGEKKGVDRLYALTREMTVMNLLAVNPFVITQEKINKFIKIIDEPGKLEELKNTTDTEKFYKNLSRVLLYTVFKNYTQAKIDGTPLDLEKIFPIFKEYEKKHYNVFVDSERFHGELRDPTANSPDKMTFSIPYPPRPGFGGATIIKNEEKDDLKEWIEDTDLTRVIADNPYIPTTCC